MPWCTINSFVQVIVTRNVSKREAKEEKSLSLGGGPDPTGEGGGLDQERSLSRGEKKRKTLNVAELIVTRRLPLPH